jgi:hypothetical protein
VSEADHSDALPVAAEHGEIVEPRPAAAELEQARRPAALPAVQAAAAAAGGFVAGAAVIGLVGRRHRRRALNGRPPTQRSLFGRRASARSATAADRLQIVGSRSLLLDVHLLGGPGAGR